jgi:hypothetical protein
MKGPDQETRLLLEVSVEDDEDLKAADLLRCDLRSKEVAAVVLAAAVAVVAQEKPHSGVCEGAMP